MSEMVVVVVVSCESRRWQGGRWDVCEIGRGGWWGGERRGG